MPLLIRTGNGAGSSRGSVSKLAGPLSFGTCGSSPKREWREEDDRLPGMKLIRDPEVVRRMELAFDLYEAAEEIMRQSLRRLSIVFEAVTVPCPADCPTR